MLVTAAVPFRTPVCPFLALQWHPLTNLGKGGVSTNSDVMLMFCFCRGRRRGRRAMQLAQGSNEYLSALRMIRSGE